MEVISIEQANSDQDLFWTREAGLFCAYFRTLQEETGRLVPPRKAFTPTLARPLLPYLSILEVKSPELLLVRLVGTAIVNRTHFDNTGGNMLDLMPPAIRQEAVAGFRELLDKPCGATYVSNEDYQNGPIPIEIVSFPFADDEGVPRFIISLSIEIDRQELMLRGDQRMALSAIFDKRMIDIGAGRDAKARRA